MPKTIIHQQYIDDINSALTHITNGDTYEVCLTIQFNGKMEAERSPLDVYKVLRKGNPAPYACYLRYDPLSMSDEGDESLLWCPQGGIAVCSTSPECFLRIDQVNTLLR